MIDQQLREKSIEACLLLADACVIAVPHPLFPFQHSAVSDAFDYATESSVAHLALGAWSRVYDETGSYGPWTYLEAAALLRDGWSPGDPVVRLKGGES